MADGRRLEMCFATCLEDGKAAPCRQQKALDKDLDMVVEGLVAAVVASSLTMVRTDYKSR